MSKDYRILFFSKKEKVKRGGEDFETEFKDFKGLDEAQSEGWKVEKIDTSLNEDVIGVVTAKVTITLAKEVEETEKVATEKASTKKDKTADK